MSRDDDLILDIVQAAKLALEFTAGIDEDAFLADAKTQAAVTRQIEIVGEAAKGLGEDFREAHPEIPLRSIAGMRDFVIHRYSDVNVARLWITVVRDFPGLIEQLEPYVPEADA